MARRNSLRIANHDYSIGRYLVTVHIHRSRRQTFGLVSDVGVELNALGLLAEEAWRYSISDRDGTTEYAFQMMPDHLHGVIELNGECGPLGALVMSAKSRATRVARANGLLPPNAPLWHRSFDARRLLSEEAFEAAIRYVESNPQKLLERVHFRGR